MDWKAEADAVIEDMRSFVKSIEISGEQESSDTRIYFDIVTLEGEHLVVMMSSNGFSICNRANESKDEHARELNSTGDQPDQTSNNPTKCEYIVYETINALLDDNSEGYRKAFAQALLTKINSLADN